MSEDWSGNFDLNSTSLCCLVVNGKEVQPYSILITEPDIASIIIANPSRFQTLSARGSSKLAKIPIV